VADAWAASSRVTMTSRCTSRTGGTAGTGRAATRSTARTLARTPVTLPVRALPSVVSVGRRHAKEDIEPLLELLRGEESRDAGIVYLQNEQYEFSTKPGGRTWSVWGSPVRYVCDREPNGAAYGCGSGHQSS
jgi:hypothetical protein